MQPPHFPAQLWTFARDASATVRLANSVGTAARQFPAEFPARLADVQPEAITVSVPNGATSALFASGSREIDLTWSSRVGRHEQHCRVQTDRGSPRRWRLMPLGAPILLQRRRYLRVAARIEVIVEVGDVAMTGTTVEISEGGFRLQLRAGGVAVGQPATLHLVIKDRPVVLAGHIVRSSRVDPPPDLHSAPETGVTKAPRRPRRAADGVTEAATEAATEAVTAATEAVPEAVTEVVIAFAATGETAEAVRGLVLHRQLRNRATRGR